MKTIKEEAYQLHLNGLSYKQVARSLHVSKTTAFEYIKEMKLLHGAKNANQKTLHLSSELVPYVRSESLNHEINGLITPVIEPKKVKEFTGDELIKKRFDCLEFEGGFLELIGKPAKLFSGIIWGLPKGGKSNFSLRFADYLQEYFGNVVYVAAEEGESATLQGKFKDIGGSKVTVIETRDRNVIRNYLSSRDFDFVFIDSINTAGIDNDFLELIKEENPKKSFISIVQATKGGNFKGDQALTHNCDFIIKVVEGVAYHEGRFGTTSEIKIFESPLYVKNKVKARHTEESKCVSEKKESKPKKLSQERHFKLEGTEITDFASRELNSFDLGTLNLRGEIVKGTTASKSLVSTIPSIKSNYVSTPVGNLDSRQLVTAARVISTILLIHWIWEKATKDKNYLKR